MIDVAAERAATPGVANVAHLNNAGAALPARAVTDAVIGHLRLEEQIGGYEAAASADDAVEHTYDAIASLIGARREEIAVVENATRAWDMAFYGFAFTAGQRILVDRAAYGSSALAALHVAARTGAVLEVVDDDEYGQVDVDGLRRRLGTGGVALVAATHVPTQSGLVNPVAAIGAVCREAGVPYLLDACQSVGQLPVDVAEIGCDLLAATGRKWLRAPRGTGFLYVSSALGARLTPPTVELRSATWTSPTTYEVRADARRFETWEGSVAGRIGLGVAVDQVIRIGPVAIAERVGVLAASLRARLAALPGVVVLDRGAQLCGIVTFAVEGCPAAEVQAAASAAGVNVSVSYSTSSQYDLPARGLAEVVRASPHYYNTEAELARLLAALPTPC
jgi:cysteine desulfurase/selenocysteine lyase